MSPNSDQAATLAGSGTTEFPPAGVKMAKLKPGVVRASNASVPLSHPLPVKDDVRTETYENVIEGL